MCGTRAPRQRACKVPSKKSEKQLTSAHRNIVAETPPADLGRNSKDSSAAAGTTEKEKQIKAIEIDLTRDEQDDKNKEDEDFIEYIPSPDLLASWKPTAAATAAKNKEKRSRSRKRLKDDLQKCTKKAKDGKEAAVAAVAAVVVVREKMLTPSRGLNVSPRQLKTSL